MNSVFKILENKITKGLINKKLSIKSNHGVADINGINKMNKFFWSETVEQFINGLPAIRSNAAAMHKSQRFKQHNHYYRGYASNFSRLQKRMGRPDRFQKPVRSEKREDTALSSSFATRADEKNVSDVWVHCKCTSQASSLQTKMRVSSFVIITILSVIRNKQMNKIMKSISLSVFLIMAVSNMAIAQDDSIFPLGEKAPNVHHTGDVWLSHLSAADSIFDYNVVVAKFAKGAKLDWHTHPKGQHLLIIEGEGLYQERGKPIEVVKKGAVVKCHPTIEHWHAATPESVVTYLAITGNERTVWLESIAEEFFQKINVDSIHNKMVEEEITKLSKDKWQWMSDKNVELLDDLFLENSMYVHMGGSWDKTRELEIIKSGEIHYKKADVHEVSVNVLDNTAILLNKITLLAVVGGKEVTNPFMVTEVYKQAHGAWKLASLSFTKLLEQE